MTFFWIVSRWGGLENAMARLAAERPDLLTREATVRPLELLSYTAIPLSVGMFPHLFMHWLTARDRSSFRLPVVAYPLCIAVVWIPSVVLGVGGHLDFPGLEGPAAGTVLVRLISLHAPELLAGLLAAGVFAAVMSSLDSQSLALGTMFTHDVVRRFAGGRLTERAQVLSGRLFVVAILALALVLSQVVDRSIFRLGVWSFSGFAALVPIAVAAAFWRRSTAAGALSAVLAAAASWIYFVARGLAVPGYTVGDTGLMPVVVMIACSTAALWASRSSPGPPKPSAWSDSSHRSEERPFEDRLRRRRCRRHVLRKLHPRQHPRGGSGPSRA